MILKNEKVLIPIRHHDDEMPKKVNQYDGLRFKRSTSAL